MSLLSVVTACLCQPYKSQDGVLISHGSKDVGEDDTCNCASLSPFVANSQRGTVVRRTLLQRKVFRQSVSAVLDHFYMWKADTCRINSNCIVCR